MVWRRVTIGILLGSLALCAWVYLRDRGSPPLREPAAVQAALDANEMLNVIAPASACAERCRTQVVGRTNAGVWRVRLTTPAWQRCFDVNVGQFGYSPQHGMIGLRSASWCRH